MAKKGSDQEQSPDKGKVRIFFAEVEGSNDSIREAIRTMAQAMTRPSQAAAPRALVNGNGEQQAIAAPSNSEQIVVESGDVSGDGALDGEVQVAAPARKRGTGQKRDHNAGIELVPDMDFRPDGKQTLREFFAEKAPKGDMAQTVVVTYYMQHTMGMTAINFGHIRTAFKDVGKPVPTDLRSTVRNMKKTKAWLNWSTPDAIQVTTQGENYVDHDMATQKAD